MFISYKLMLKIHSVAWRPRKQVTIPMVLGSPLQSRPKEAAFKDRYVHYKQTEMSKFL